MEGNGRSIAGKAVDQALEKPAGVEASHIGHVMLKPVDGAAGGGAASSKHGGKGAKEGKQQAKQSVPEADPADDGEVHEARVGHTMVAPIDATLDDGADKARQSAADGITAGQDAGKAVVAAGSNQPAGAKQGKAAAGTKSNATATAASEGGKQPSINNKTQPAPKKAPAAKPSAPPPPVSLPKQQPQPSGASTPKPPQDSSADSDEEWESLERKHEEELRHEQQDKEERAAKLAVEAAEDRAAELAEGDGEAGLMANDEEEDNAQQAWHPTHGQPAMFGSCEGCQPSVLGDNSSLALQGRRGLSGCAALPNMPAGWLPRAGAQPGLLGLVFLSVALVSWNRLQQWRQHGGAGYNVPSHQHGV